MPFEYIGLRSLRSPEIFQQILASSVEQTGLAYDFEIRGDLKNVDQAFDLFQHHAFHFLSSDGITPRRALLGITALAIHCISLHRIFERDQVYFQAPQVVGLHAAAIWKNPNEAVALTFGLAIAAIELAWVRSPTNLVQAPARINLGTVRPADIRDAIRLIAENRNLDVRADNGQFRLTFLRLSKLLTKLQVRRLRPRRRR